MMLPRLLLARDLLTDDGVIAISIDEHEICSLLNIIVEIYGENNILAVFPRVTKKAGKSSEIIAKNHDFLILIRKSDQVCFYNNEQVDSNDYPFIDEFLEERGPYKLNQCLDYDSLQYSSSLDYPIETEKGVLYPGGDFKAYQSRKSGKHARADWAWRWSREKYDFGKKHGFIVIKDGKDRPRIYTKTYLNATIEEYPRNSKNYFISIKKRSKSISTLEYTNNLYSNDNASKGLVALFGKKVFDYSKPVSLLKNLIRLCTDDNDLIMDFFSGSATAAQAVFEQNLADSSSRKFILIQIPECLEMGSIAQQEGFDNICNLAKERIIRAGKEVDSLCTKEPNKSTLDTGFRVLKIDSSNYENVTTIPILLERNIISGWVDNIKSDRTYLDLLFSVFADLVISYSAHIEVLPHERFFGHEVFSVEDGVLVACFDENLDNATIEAMAQLQPSYCVVRDASFVDDAAAANFEELFKTFSPDTQLRVL